MRKVTTNFILSILMSIFGFALIGILTSTIQADGDIYGQILSAIISVAIVLVFAISFSTLTILDKIKELMK